jgi:hypothetical protein
MADDNKWLKNKGPLLVDKARGGYFDRLPPWLREMITIRVEKQKVDAKIDDIDPAALDSELKQEFTDEKLRTNRYLGDGEAGSGNDMGELPASHPSEVVITGTGQVADVTEVVSGTESHLVEGPPLQDGTSEQVGGVWVTKKVEAPTFDDKVFQLAREDLIPKEFRALVPEKLETHTVDGTAALPTLGSGEFVKKEEQKKVGVKTVTVQSRDMTTPPILIGQKIDPQWNGAVLDLEQKIVPASTIITPIFGTTDASIKPIDGTNALQETWKVHGTFPTLYHRAFDPDLGVQTITIQTIVAAGSSIDGELTTQTVDFEDKPIDAVHTLRKRIEPTTGIATYNEYTTSVFTFPGILSYLSFALVALAEANRKEPQWTAGIRASFSAPTKIRNQTEFYPYASPPPPIALFTWAQTDIVFKGISYSINLQNVLTDAWSNIGVSYSGDAYYGSTVDRFSISATSPSASNYTANIGIEQPIASVVERYKRYWVRKTSYVVMR